MLSTVNADQLPAPPQAKHPRLPSTANTTPGLDPESQAWIDSLSAPGPAHTAAIRALYALLLKAAHFEMNRRHAAVSHLSDDQTDDLAHQSADDALGAVLRRLDEFRGGSRFTTWAYKFALVEAAVKVRRLAWRTRAIPLAPGGWTLNIGDRSTPQADPGTNELLAGLQHAIQSDLSPRQREVLVATAVYEVPIDVLAQRLGTTRAALYETVHDARRNIRNALEARGLSLSEYLEAQSS